MEEEISSGTKWGVGLGIIYEIIIKYMIIGPKIRCKNILDFKFSVSVNKQIIFCTIDFSLSLISYDKLSLFVYIMKL